MGFRRSSWNYRTHALDTAEAEPRCRTPAWPDCATGERLVQRHYDAYRATGDTVRGTGSCRQLRPGARFELTQHPQGGRFACLHGHHRARNNLGAEVLEQVEQVLGAPRCRRCRYLRHLTRTATTLHSAIAR